MSRLGERARILKIMSTLRRDWQAMADEDYSKAAKTNDGAKRTYEYCLGGAAAMAQAIKAVEDGIVIPERAKR